MTNDLRVTMVCQAPLAHGAFGESAGNAVLCRRMTVVSLPGRPRVPVVSGNALRGVLRRLVMRDLFDRAGLDRAALGNTWDRLYAALANGGHLEGAGEEQIRPAAIRELRVALPPLSVFGAALFSWMLPGRVSIGFLWPRCIETHAAGLVSSAPEVHAEDLVVELTHTRHVEREEHDPEVSGVTPMPVTLETLAPGTELEARISFLPQSTEVERAVISYGLDRVAAVGGKAGAGLGRVSVAHDGTAAPYAAWLEAQGPALAERLTALAATLARK